MRKICSAAFLILCMLSTPLSGCIEGPWKSEMHRIEKNSGDDTLRILTYDIMALSDEMISAFTNQTGISVEFIRANDAGGVLETAILNKDRPQYDLIIGIDNSFLGDALAFSLFQANDVNVENISLKALSSHDGSYAVPYDMGSICINYDTSYVDGENVTVPMSLWNFTETEWKGKVAVQNPRTSSPGRSFLIATTQYFAEDTDENTDYTDWWAAMSANDVIVSSGWTEAYETHYSGGYGPWMDGYIGDAQAVVSYCHSPGVEAWYGENWTQSAALNLAGASFLQIEYAAIPNGAEDISQAKSFIEYLISPEVNSQMPTQNFMYSVLDGYDLPEENGYRHHSVSPIDTQISSENIEAHIDEWLNNWDAAI